MGQSLPFQRELQRRYPDEHARLWKEIQARHQIVARDVAFARSSSNPVDRRLEFCALFLATIQILEKRGEKFEAIRETCVAIAHETVRPKNALQRWLKSLPAKLIETPIGCFAARVMRKKTGRRGHKDGFLVRILTDPAATNGLGFGFDILECGVCKLFDKHGARKYVPILCEVDELTSSLAGLELARTGTLATGHPMCDFRFRLLPSSKR